LADQDVVKVISDNQERGSEERKILEGKRAAVRAAEQAAEAEEAAKTESAVKVDADEDEDEEVEEKEKEEAEGEEEEEGEEDDEDEDEETGESGANANAGPVHEGITCDGCQVSILMTIANSSLTNNCSRQAIPSSVLVGSVQSAQTMTFVIVATPQVSTMSTACLKSSIRPMRLRLKMWYV
jgi:uncharacterized membrane protein YdbT with pleckstrin-like domain